MTLPTDKKQQELTKLMDTLEIKPSDLIIKSISGKGKGGQKQNKTQNCIYIKHIPTHIEVKCQKSRSKETNLFLSKRMLCEKIMTARGIKTKTQQKIDKMKKQKKRRDARSKEKYDTH